MMEKKDNNLRGAANVFLIIGIMLVIISLNPVIDKFLSLYETLKVELPTTTQIVIQYRYLVTVVIAILTLVLIMAHHSMIAFFILSVWVSIVTVALFLPIHRITTLLE